MSWITAVGLLLCLFVPASRWIQHKRQVRRRQRPIALDLATAPARIRHNLRRPSTSCPNTTKVS